MADYERGVADTKKAVCAKIKELAAYFDKFECYGGRYGSGSGCETLGPDDLARLIQDMDVEP